MGCLEKAQVQKGPGEVVAVVLCALSDLGHKAVLGLEWIVLLIIPQWPPSSSVILGSGLRLSTGTWN